MNHREFENFEVVETGGGCQALRHETDYGFILITVAYDPSLPMIGEDFAVGFYDENGDPAELSYADDGAQDLDGGCRIFPAATSDVEVESFIDAISARIYASKGL